MSSKKKQKEKQHPQPQQLPQLVCAMCEKEGAPSCNTCSGCGSVSYCNAECQRAHWALHKADCNRIKKEKAKKEAARDSGSGSGSGLGDMGSLLNALMPPPQPQRYQNRHIINACIDNEHEELTKFFF